MTERSIPERWIRDYVDQCLAVAKTLPNNGPMQTAMLLRGEHVMDMVTAYRERNCDCIRSGNEAKPLQHGADRHAKSCAIYKEDIVANPEAKK